MLLRRQLSRESGGVFRKGCLSFPQLPGDTANKVASLCAFPSRLPLGWRTRETLAGWYSSVQHTYTECLPWASSKLGIRTLEMQKV